MLQLYVTTNSASCRKAEAWLQDHQIPYKKRNLLIEPPSIPELKDILYLTERGTLDLLSSRSDAFRQIEDQLDTLHLSDLLALIQKQPAELRKPILWNQKRGLISSGTYFNYLNTFYLLKRNLMVSRQVYHC